MNAYNFDFFQIPSAGVNDETLGLNKRSIATKISNFSDSVYGSKNLFKDKDDGLNRLPEDRGAIADENPFVAGSTVKRVRDDQPIRMDMDTRHEQNPSMPNFDFSALDARDPAGFVKPDKYPSEGWRSFGGKNDFPVKYVGVI